MAPRPHTSPSTSSPPNGIAGPPVGVHRHDVGVAHQAQRRGVGVAALDAGDDRGASRPAVEALDVEPGTLEVGLQQIGVAHLVAGLRCSVVDALVADQLLEELGGGAGELVGARHAPEPTAIVGSIPCRLGIAVRSAHRRQNSQGDVQGLEDGEDLLAVALELGRADPVARDQLDRSRGAGEGDAAEVLVAGDDVRRHAVGPRPLGAPRPQHRLGVGRRTPQLVGRGERRPTTVVLDALAVAHAQRAARRQANEHRRGRRRPRRLR